MTLARCPRVPLLSALLLCLCIAGCATTEGVSEASLDEEGESPLLIELPAEAAAEAEAEVPSTAEPESAAGEEDAGE